MFQFYNVSEYSEQCKYINKGIDLRIFKCCWRQYWLFIRRCLDFIDLNKVVLWEYFFMNIIEDIFLKEYGS